MAAFFLVLFVLAGIVLSFALFFKVTEVTVSGKLERYTASNIIATSGVKKGDNLFLFSTAKVEDQIWSAFPYIQEVRVRRVLPGKVLIEIGEVQELMVARSGGQYLVFSDTMKALEFVSEKPKDMIEILGLEPKDPVLGKTIGTDNAEQLEFLTRLYAALKEAELTGVIQQIDISDKLNYALILDNRFFVMIGTGHNVAYKIDMLKVTFEDNLYATDTGYIDLSVAGKATYKPGDYLTDPGNEYVEPPPAEPEEELAETDTDGD